MVRAKAGALDDPRRQTCRAQARDADTATLSRKDRPNARSDAGLDDDIGDELLRLIFIRCHLKNVGATRARRLALRDDLRDEEEIAPRPPAAGSTNRPALSVARATLSNPSL